MKTLSTVFYWVVVVVGALVLLPFTLIGAWFMYKAEKAEFERHNRFEVDE